MSKTSGRVNHFLRISSPHHGIRAVTLLSIWPVTMATWTVPPSCWVMVLSPLAQTR
jgi:hypothetical protein